jgi:hypothetical protein
MDYLEVWSHEVQEEVVPIELISEQVA